MTTETYSLVFDTETTGLPPRTRTRIPALSEMPWIIQLGAILFRDSDRQEVAHFSSYVQPYHGKLAGSIPQEKFWIDNNLTADHIGPTAIPLATALKMLNQLARPATRLVAHNMNFDFPRISDSFSRIGEADRECAILALPRFCTMLTLTPILKIPKPYPKPNDPYKWPNLPEAYRHFIDPLGFADAHDAMADCRAAAAVMYEIEAQGHALVSA